MNLFSIRMLTAICFFSSLGQALSPRWNLNDVSYLYPIPKNTLETTENLLKPGDSGPYGGLLPQSVFEMVPTLNNGGSGQIQAYEHELKVVGLRIDPCPNSFIPSECSPEIRLVWQLVSIDEDTKAWTTQDATVHSFYKLSSADFEVVKRSLYQLKMSNAALEVSTELQPLGIHPAFLNPATRVGFTRTLNDLIRSHCGEQNLVKVTFMRLLTPNIWWRFGGIVKNQAKQWVPVGIPRLTINFQDIFNSAPETASQVNFPGKEMDAIFNILPGNYPAEDDLTTVINHGFRADDETDREDFTQKISAVERFQNPRFTNPNNLDCASCHFADSTRFYINTRFPDLALWQTKYNFVNPNKGSYDLSNSTIVPRATRAIRAFGYFGDQPAINQRVIHDSAESAEWLNR